MSRKISNILDINPDLKKRWTVLVQVVETGHIKPSKAGDNHKRLLLTDSQGTQVFALIYANHLRYFAKTLKPYKQYYISNANVTNNDPRFRATSYEFSWSLTSSTLVEEFPEDIPPILPCEFNFTPFKELHRHAESARFQNIRAMVIKCFPNQQIDIGSDDKSEQTTRRNVIIVNEEKKLMILTMWDTFQRSFSYYQAKFRSTNKSTGQREPTVAHLVSSVSHLVSSTTFNVKDPVKIPFSKVIYSNNYMYKDNKAEILHLLQKETFKDTDMLLPYPDKKEMVPIAKAVASWKTSKTAWVKGKLTLPRQDRSFSHTGCANCQKSLDADITWIVTCPSCKMESEVLPTSRATIEINDGTGTIHATISTPDIEKFIPFTASQLRDAEEFGKNVHDAIASMSAVAYICSYETTFSQQQTTRFSIVKAHMAKEDSPTELLPDPHASGIRIRKHRMFRGKPNQEDKINLQLRNNHENSFAF